MFGNNTKKINALNNRVDNLAKGVAVAFGVKAVIDIAHSVATAKNTFDINRLNRAASGVPTDKDLDKFAKIRDKWAAKAAVINDNNDNNNNDNNNNDNNNNDNNNPPTATAPAAAAPTATAPVTPPPADDADKDKADKK